jgi:hypothetical protein
MEDIEQPIAIYQVIILHSTPVMPPTICIESTRNVVTVYVLGRKKEKRKKRGYKRNAYKRRKVELLHTFII